MRWISLAAFLWSSIILADGFCPTCGMNSNYGSIPFYGSGLSYGMPSFSMGYSPWYMPYGAMSYSNFYYPSPWMGGGMNMGFYPGNGMVGMGKPNLYVSGPKGTQIHIQVKMAKGSTLLAAVPLHGEEGWNGVIQDDGSMLSQNAVYPYFFYDFRLNENQFQDEAGFCVAPDQVIASLSEILKKKGFKPREIEDFKEYWSIKLPPSEKYCVFPQENKDLDQVAPLHIDPPADQVTRVGFMIVVAEGILPSSSRKFTRLPAQSWTESPSVSPKSKKSSGIEIREWGVGFVGNIR